MPSRLTYPGVYVEEQRSGVRTVAGVATSTALFVGMAQRGPTGRPIYVRSIDQYTQIFGPELDYGEMGVQVRQFFLNGGSEAIVVRPEAPGLEPATATLQTEAGGDSLLITARDSGAQGSEIRVEVDYDTPTPELTFNLTIYRRSVDLNGAVTISDQEFFGDVSVDPDHPRDVVTTLRDGSALIEAELAPGAPAAETGGFSQSGLVFPNGAGDRATLLGTLLAGGAAVRVSVDGGLAVRATLPTPIGDISTWPEDAAEAINGALISNSQPGQVTGSWEAFGATGQVLRFTSSGAGARSVVFVPAGAGDATASLQLGGAAGGIEFGGWSHLRPAPSGFATRLSSLATADFAGVTDLDRLVGLGETDRSDIGTWSFDDGTPDAPYAPLAATFPDAEPFLQGTVSTEGEGSLRNLAAYLDTLAASLGTTLGPDWTAARHGLRIVLRPTFGDSNTGQTATLTSDGAYDLGDASNIAETAAARNTAAYSLGQSGAELRQTRGDAGADGGVPTLQNYDDAYDVVRREVDLFNLLILPRGEDQTDAQRAELLGQASVFAQNERAFLLVDPPADWEDVDDARAGITDLRLGVVTDHAAVYWPRVRVAGLADPVDPAGTVAGVMARTDTRRGVWKAPAGLEARTLSVTGFEHMVSDAENGVTNPLAINTLRQFASGGVIWGARTMAGFDSSGEDDYRYVPVRRLALFLEESLYRGLQFAVFEPNDEPLWAQIRLAAGAFMQNLFRQGAFAGTKASDAYNVRCDSTTTTQNDINLGRVNVIVAFAPLRPAEFVVLVIRQLAGQVQV